MNNEFLKNLGLSREAQDEILSALKAEYDKGLNDGKKALDDYLLKEKTKEALDKAKPKKAEILNALIDFDKLSLKDGTLLGLDEQIQALKEENPFLFQEENPEPKFTKKSDSALKITKKSFAKMPYSERVKLFAKNPSLYKELIG